jgi:preprotein translocase subunit SecY
MFNLFSGGALSRFTVFALGIMPYISASIIMQLVTVSNSFNGSFEKEGRAGQKEKLLNIHATEQYY